MPNSRETSDSSSTTISVNRRTYLTAAGGLAVGLAGCLGGQDGSGGTKGSTNSQQPYKGQTLRTTVWSGSYTERFRNTIKKWYEEETGATLRVIPAWSAIISKIRAAPKDNPPYDVTVTDGYFYYLGRNANLFLPIRYDNVPNYEGVFPYFKKFRADDNKHGVPVDGEPLALSYSADLDWTPKTWGDLTKDKAKNVTLDGGFWVYPTQIGAVIADQKAGTSELYEEQYHDAPFDALRQIDVAKWYGSGAEIWQLFRQGVANFGQYYYSTSKLKARSSNMNLKLSVPTMNGGYFDNWCVVRGTDKRDMAEHFLNFMLDPEIQTRWSESSWELKSHSDTKYPDFVAEDLPTTNEGIQKLNFPKWTDLSEYSDSFNMKFKRTKQST